MKLGFTNFHLRGVWPYPQKISCCRYKGLWHDMNSKNRRRKPHGADGAFIPL